jgi:F-type H+-transporting ATPase subunit delta
MLKTHSQLARRYAKALFELAGEKNNVAQIEQDMTNIVAVLYASKETQDALKSPILSTEQSKKLLDVLAKQCNASKLTEQVLSTLQRNRRVSFLLESAEAFIALAKAHKGIVEAQVTSAVELTALQVQALEAQLSNKLNKTVKVYVTVDKEILGGLVVTIGSQMWDDSIAGKINRLHAVNKQAIAAF